MESHITQGAHRQDQEAAAQSCHALEGGPTISSPQPHTPTKVPTWTRVSP